MMIDTKAIQLKDYTKNIANNPLPYHQVNVVEVNDVWNWEKSLWDCETEEAMTATAEMPMVVQTHGPFEVEVTVSMPPSLFAESLLRSNMIQILSLGITTK